MHVTIRNYLILLFYPIFRTFKPKIRNYHPIHD